MGADSQPISTAQPKAPSPPRILLGQQLFAAQWHQHSTVQEGGTTATLIPGAHAGDTACGDSQSLNPFLIFQIHLFPLGKKNAVFKEQGQICTMERGSREKQTGQRHQNPTDLQCKAMHCKHAVGLETQHAATTQHRRDPEHLQLSEPGCPVVNTAFRVGFFWLFGDFCKLYAPQKEEESTHHIPP